VETANLGKPPHEQGFEDVELLLGIAHLEQTLAHFGGCRTPEVVEGGVATGELVRGDAE
jgi:hypothetical protein